MVMENFYTRHVLALQVLVLIDSECKVLATEHLKNVDEINRPGLKDAIESLKHAEGEKWRLVHVLMKDTGEIAKNTRFSAFKDRSIVSIYT